MADFDFPCLHRSEPTGATFDCGCGLRNEPIFTCTHPALGIAECVIRMGKRPKPALPRSCTACNFREGPPAPPKPEPLQLPIRPPNPGFPKHELPDYVRGLGERSRARKAAKQRAAAKAREKALAEEQVRRQSRATNVLTSFDELNLAPGTRGKRFNSSILEDPTNPGGYLLAFRDGWIGSEIHLVRLDSQFQPIGDAWQLELKHPLEANYGREDPRLFLHNGRVHLAYIGVTGEHSIRHTSVLYARLTDDLQVEQKWYPYYPERKAWEKNWSFFSSGGELFAIYSISPHRILRIDGHRAELAHERPFSLPWRGGQPRGGASPLLVGGEWWHVFHDRIEENGHRIYRAGLYTFATQAPFEPLRIIAEPILAGDSATLPENQVTTVVFPCGAVVQGEALIVSSGVHDRWTELHAFEVAALDGRLLPQLTFRAGTNDHLIYHAVVECDEYRLGETRFDANDVVIDIGSHVGSFARLAWSRGSRRVECYEASPDNFAALHQGLSRLPGLRLTHAAVWSGSGETVYSNPPSGHAENLGGSWVSTAGAHPVPTVAFDELLRAAGRVRFLKIDCERSEFVFISGSRELRRVDQIAMEYHATDELPLSLLTDALRYAGMEIQVVPAADNPLMGMIYGWRSSGRPA